METFQTALYIFVCAYLAVMFIFGITKMSQFLYEMIRDGEWMVAIMATSGLLFVICLILLVVLEDLGV